MRTRWLRFLLSILVFLPANTSCTSLAGNSISREIELVASVVPVRSASPSLARRQWEPDGKAYKLGRHIVVMPAKCGADRARRFLRSVHFILDRFQRDNKTRLDPLIIYITDRESFTVPAWQPWFIIAGIKHISLIGVHCGGTGEIAVVAGDGDSIPALYHEFVHALIGDGSHSDGRWKRWEERGKQLTDRIRLHPERT